MLEQIYINSLIAAVCILIVTMVYRVSKLYSAYEKQTKESQLKKSSHSHSASGDEQMASLTDKAAYQLKAA